MTRTRFDDRPVAILTEPSCWHGYRFGLPGERWQSLANLTFWIVGAGTGYGRVLTQALAAADARVFLSGRRADKLAETLAICRGFGIDTAKCHMVPADITNEESLNAAAAIIAAQTPCLNGWIHCSALPLPPSSPNPLANLDTGHWRRLIDTNLTGAWLTWKAGRTLLLASRQWRALLFSSAAAWSDTPGYGPYNITKAALNNFGMSLAAEVTAMHPEQDAQINIIDPGEASTEMNQGSGKSPNEVLPMALALLSHPPGGPSGRFFHRDGRHLAFANTLPYPKSLLPEETEE